MQHNGDASVEEILESIKKVIARDNRADAAEIRNRRERAGIARNTPERSATPDVEPADAEEAEEILDLVEADLVDEDAEAFGPSAEDDAFAANRADDSDSANDSDEPLINAGGSASMRDNFAALAMLAQPGAAPQIVRSGETSLEGLTRELLRPMLAQWLDDNLPPMVERMVQAEIARIAGKRS
ncbi:DUF2497 domain-containing protein [Pseudopontixanthobacter vadosimaris]|uniref:DUF2497 domain-containing protein n=1 Tax=Pseudopontixanthobacter vadosimaris TaxID=2726450 RepID=UPI001473B539|nr:DUF2497 domain-containing protein [Pseudopontixanthobacter vadosimaris]